MGRPIYESEADRSRERAVIEDVCAVAGGFKAVKLKEFSKVDFALMRGPAVKMLCEVKVRDRHYPQMFLSLEKVQALRNYAAATGIAARVIFATPKGIFAKKIGPLEIDGWVGLGGRTDRGDPDDVEMVVYFGPLVVGGKVYREEVEPMTRIADSRREWFVREEAPA